MVVHCLWSDWASFFRVPFEGVDKTSAEIELCLFLFLEELTLSTRTFSIRFEDCKMLSSWNLLITLALLRRFGSFFCSLEAISMVSFTFSWRFSNMTVALESLLSTVLSELSMDFLAFSLCFLGVVCPFWGEKFSTVIELSTNAGTSARNKSILSVTWSKDAWSSSSRLLLLSFSEHF